MHEYIEHVNEMNRLFHAVNYEQQQQQRKKLHRVIHATNLC